MTLLAKGQKLLITSTNDESVSHIAYVLEDHDMSPGLSSMMQVSIPEVEKTQGFYEPYINTNFWNIEKLVKT